MYRLPGPLAPTLALGLLGALALTAAPAERQGDGKGADRPSERAEWNASFRLDPQGRLLASNRLVAIEEACLVPVDESMRGGGRDPLVPGTRWEPIGPRPQTALSLWGATSGRITALGLHPGNPDLVLVGSATGGIWRSTDGGASFRPVSDDAPALAISGFAFSPASPDVVYAATGEQDSAYIEQRPTRSLGLYLGAGLLRSVDAGDTWQRIDRNLPENGILSRVLVHPVAPHLVLAGLYVVPDPSLPIDASLYQFRPGGLWRSTDAGVTFAKVFEHAVTDLVQDPHDPSTVYVGVGLSKGSSGCNGCGCATCPSPSGVYRSRDFGRTFEPLLVGGRAETWPLAQAGPVRIAVSSASPTVLYASVLDDTYHHAGGGVFRSGDAGTTWRKVAAPPEGCGPQCHYDHTLAVSPADPSLVFFGGVDLFISSDGGTSWVRVDTYSRSLHPDLHAFAFHPERPDVLWIGSDGGLYSTLDRGATFRNHNGTLTLAQLTGLAPHPTDPDFLIGGTQDNGTLRYRGSWTWADRAGGDGGIALIRRNDPTKILASHYYAYLEYSASSGDAFASVTPIGTLMDADGNPKDPMSFYPPIVAAPGATGTAFLATNRVWSNPTFGQNAGSWRARSDSGITESLLTALEVVGDGNGVIWAGDRVGGVFLSTDGGVRWDRRDAGLPRGIVTRLRATSESGLSAYATFGSYFGSPSRHVFRTSDGGRSWSNLSANLPDVPVLSLAVDSQDPGDLFVGTDAGVFRSRDGGASWASFSEGLPLAAVTELVFSAKGDLLAATYGRGVFRITGRSALQLPPQADFSWSPASPEPGKPVSFADRSAGTATAFAWDFGDGGTSSDPNPSKVFDREGSFDVVLAASGPGGSSSRTRRVTVAAAAPQPAVVLQVPVVLEALGVGGARFTSDLVLASRSAGPTRVTLEMLPAPGVGGSGPKVSLSLGAGRQHRLPDVVAYLRQQGWTLPPDAVTGTLRLTFEDVRDPNLVFAGSRASSPNPNRAVGGTFGLYLPAVPARAASTSQALVAGLREDGLFRSNLAVVDVPGGSGPATLSVQVVDGETGARPAPALSIPLQPGEWRQLGSVLAGSGIRNGMVRVTRSGGGDNAFLAYGVVNDGGADGSSGTSDGTYLSPDPGQGLLPVVLSAGGGGVLYRTELVLANPLDVAAKARLRYSPAPELGGGGGPYESTLTVPAARQVRFGDAIAFLRDTAGMPLSPDGTPQGGTLEVTGVSALARVWNPNPDSSVGGTFGLAFPAVAEERRARSSAWVFGLRQDPGARSNVAVADARVGDPATVTYAVDVFDGAAGDGTVPVATYPLTLAGGQWSQLAAPLARAGVSQGYVRVRASRPSDFVAYGVVNDGALPGDPTSDGSYVPMSGAE